MSVDKGGQQLLAGVVAFVALIGAFVVLTVQHADTGALVALGGPVVMALLVTGHVSKVTEEQNSAIATIQKQTNGVLDARIRDGVTEVLTRAGVLPPADVPAVAVADPATSGNG